MAPDIVPPPLDHDSISGISDDCNDCCGIPAVQQRYSGSTVTPGDRNSGHMLRHLHMIDEGMVALVNANTLARVRGVAALRMASSASPVAAAAATATVGDTAASSRPTAAYSGQGIGKGIKSGSIHARLATNVTSGKAQAGCSTPAAGVASHGPFQAMQSLLAASRTTTPTLSKLTTCGRPLDVVLAEFRAARDSRTQEQRRKLQKSASSCAAYAIGGIDDSEVLRRADISFFELPRRNPEAKDSSSGDGFGEGSVDRSTAFRCMDRLI